MFFEILYPNKHILAALFFLLMFSLMFMPPFLNLQKIAIIFQTVKKFIR